jgi:hypothetical protein
VALSDAVIFARTAPAQIVIVEPTFAIPDIVATVAKTVALHPGDVILTGAATGVGFPKGRLVSPVTSSTSPSAR